MGSHQPQAVAKQLADALYKAAQFPAAPPAAGHPDLYMPAMPPLGLLGLLEKYCWYYRRRRLFRRHILPLLKLDAHLLENLGYRREDLHWANRLPLRRDALAALQERQRLQPPDTAPAGQQ